MATSIVVASSVWNLAGDWLNRVDFLKSQVIGGMIRGNSRSVGLTVAQSYRDSCALRMRKFLKWSRNDGDFQWFIGVTNGRLPGPELDQVLIASNIPLDPAYSVGHIISADIGRATVSYWVAAYMNEHHRGLTFSWKYDPVTNTVTAVLDVGGTVVTFNPVDFVPGDLYLYVEYMRSDFQIFWFIYHQGTGDPELDTQFSLVTPEMLGTFYPPIPFRYDNQSIVEYNPDLTPNERYPVCREAFRRAFGGDFDQVQEKVLDNPGIGDIDFVYAVFAASLNTREQASRKYIFKFLEYLLNNTDNLPKADEEAWLEDWDDDVSRPPVPWKSLEWASIRTGVGSFKTVIRWAFLHEESGTGLLWSGAKIDQLYFEVPADPLVHYPPDEGDGFNQQVTLSWQVTPNYWRRLTITGLQYNNYVYTSEMSLVTAKQAILLTTKESEFLVPVHEVLFESLPTVDKIQMGTSCSFLVFNCYVVDQEEWYESDWFKVLVVAVIVVVSVVAAIFTGGTSLGVGGGAVAGLLGGAGVSLTAALVIAAATEALAGILVAYLISEMSVALFGEEWGPIVGAILSFVFSFGMSAGSITELISALTRPDTWVALASATGNAVASYMQYQASQIAEDTAKMLEEYGDKTAEVQRLYQEEVSGSSSGVDLSVVNRYIQETSERPSDFFRRTLATGSDVAEITLKQIDDFTSYNLQLVLP